MSNTNKKENLIVANATQKENSKVVNTTTQTATTTQIATATTTQTATATTTQTATTTTATPENIDILKATYTYYNFFNDLHNLIENNANIPNIDLFKSKLKDLEYRTLKTTYENKKVNTTINTNKTNNIANDLIAILKQNKQLTHKQLVDALKINGLTLSNIIRNIPQICKKQILVNDGYLKNGEPKHKTAIAYTYIENTKA